MSDGKHDGKTVCPQCPDMAGRPAGVFGRPKECRNYNPDLDVEEIHSVRMAHSIG